MEITNAVVPSMLSEDPSTKKVKISRDSATKMHVTLSIENPLN